jgi:hypothetical protein
MLLCKSDRSVVSPATKVAGNGQFFSNFQSQYQISYSITYPWLGAGISPAWRENLQSASPVMCDMAPLSGDNNKNTLAPRGNPQANSDNHDGKGQNVGYGDTHVEFQKDPYAGDSQDNIFTLGPVYSQIPVITLGVLPASPTNTDFVMVPVRKTSDGTMGP